MAEREANTDSGHGESSSGEATGSPDRGATVIHVRPDELAARNCPPADDPDSLVVYGVSDPDGAVDLLSEVTVDCVVCEYDLGGEQTGLDVLRRVREQQRSLPVVLCTDEPDGEVASLATRLGVTEYLPRTDEESVTDRVTSILDATEPVSDSVGQPGRIERSVERFDEGFFLVDGDWRITFANRRARETFDHDGGVLGTPLDDLVSEGAGEQIRSAGERAAEHDEPTSVRILVDGRWLSVRIMPSSDGYSVHYQDVTDDKRRENALSGLLMATRTLMTADTREAVAVLVAEAAADTLNVDHGGVYLDDPETGDLVPAAAVDGSVSELPDHSVGEGLVGLAFERGGTAVYEDIVESVGDISRYGGVRSLLVLPLGEHGVLSLGREAPNAFEWSEVSVAEILATNAAAALKRAERQETLSQYETVIETVNEMVYVLDEDGRFTFLTAPLADRLGYDRETLLGRHVAEILPASAVERGRTIIRELLDDGAASGSYDTRAVGADGEQFPIEIEISLLPGEEFSGTVGVVHDRTELAAARAKLERERDRLTQLFENLPDPAVDTEFVDGEPVIRSVNPAFEETFGYSAGEAEGTPINDLLVEPDGTSGIDATDNQAIDRKVRQGEVVTQEIRRHTAAGTSDFLFHGIPYRTGDRHGSFAIYTDITEQRDRERRLQVLSRVLRHNIRNDITIVRGYAEFLQESIDDPDLLGAADELVRAATTVNNLTEEVHQIQRLLEQDRGGPVDVAAITEGIVEDYVSVYEDATVEVDVPEGLFVDAGERISAAIAQLLENAVVHNDADEPWVEISARRDGDRVRLAVADDGPGIPESERALVAGDREITDLEHGSGLGLWIVRWIVDSCDGEVHFETPAEGGSRAVISLRPAAPGSLSDR